MSAPVRASFFIDMILLSGQNLFKHDNEPEKQAAAGEYRLLFLLLDLLAREAYVAAFRLVN